MTGREARALAASLHFGADVSIAPDSAVGQWITTGNASTIANHFRMLEAGILMGAAQEREKIAVWLETGDEDSCEELAKGVREGVHDDEDEV